MFGSTLRRSVALLALGALVGITLAAAPPADQPPVPDANQAMVRFLHAAPNAQVESIVLTSGDENVEPQEFSGLAYGEMSEYVPVQAVGYEVAVSLAGVDAAAEESAEGVEADVPTVALDSFGGEYYTIALIGVVPPDEEAQENEGFFDWLEGLFTSDDDQYAFRTLVMSDGTTAAVMQDEAEIRIAHLAPGTDALDLVAVRSDGDIDVLHTVGYGEVSGFGRIIPSETTLQLRAQGSEAVLFDLTDENLSTGRGHTVFVTGTPVEQVPLEVTVVANPQVAVNTSGVGAVPPGAATFDATQMAMMRDSLIALEERLMAIGDRLANLEGVEGAQDEVAAAQEELNEAMDLLLAAREQVEAQPAQQPVPPAEPAGDGDGG